MGIIQMSQKEAKQIPIFDQLKKDKLTQIEAAKLLRLSVRQVRRKIKRYLKWGPSGLAHKSRGRPGNRKIPDEQRSKITALYREKYPDFGPTLAAEKLFEHHSIEINPETLRLMLLSEGLWIKKRKRSSHRKWRPRKEHFGELVQLDGSPHGWFEGRAKKCCLVAFIDDATGQIWCEFAPNESHSSVMQATKRYCSLYGKPLALYADRGGVFKVNLHNPDNELKTQYERALSELDIELIHARSPQAKGRVERLFKTLQDRLVKELRLKTISDIEGANKFLRTTFISKYNQKFAKQPKAETSFFRKTNTRELEKALCIKDTRKLRNNFTIRYNNKNLQLDEQQKTIIQPKDIIQVWEYWDGEIELYIRTVKLYFDVVAKENVKERAFTKEKNYVATKKLWIPPKDHPWRKSNSLFFK